MEQGKTVIVIGIGDPWSNNRPVQGLYRGEGMNNTVDISRKKGLKKPLKIRLQKELPKPPILGLRRPSILFGIALFSVFSVELLIMFFLSRLPSLGPLREAFLDAALLTAILFPIFYVFMLLPLRSRMSQGERLLAATRNMALHDALTGLPNRILLMDRLKTALSHARRTGEKLGLLVIDLDNFKPINDQFGHDAGDHILDQTVHQIVRNLRKSDTLARMGGDEFVLLLPTIRMRQSTGLIARQILDYLQEPIPYDGHEVRVTASIGIATYPEDGITAQELLKKADAAMYTAKNAGRNNYAW